MWSTPQSKNYVKIMRGNKRQRIHRNLMKKAIAEYDEQPPEVTPIISLENLDDLNCRAKVWVHL